MKSSVFILLGLLIGLSAGYYGLISSLERFVQVYEDKTALPKQNLQSQFADSNTAGQLPKNLFDIKLEVDKSRVTQTEGLVMRVSFTNFGTEPTLVNLTFIIFDSQGNNVNQESDSLMVETESVFKKQFKDFKLKPGKYTLVLKTVYGNAIENEFKQEFEVVRDKFLGIF